MHLTIEAHTFIDVAASAAQCSFAGVVSTYHAMIRDALWQELELGKLAVVRH